jgi:hypothetical protein
MSFLLPTAHSRVDCRDTFSTLSAGKIAVAAAGTAPLLVLSEKLIGRIELSWWLIVYSFSQSQRWQLTQYMIHLVSHILYFVQTTAFMVSMICSFVIRRKHQPCFRLARIFRCREASEKEPERHQDDLPKGHWQGQHHPTSPINEKLTRSNQLPMPARKTKA